MKVWAALLVIFCQAASIIVDYPLAYNTVPVVKALFRKYFYYCIVVLILIVSTFRLEG